MRRQVKNNKHKKLTDRRRSSASSTAPAVLPVYDSSSLDPFQLSTCYICGGVEDEDLIILCDGSGCNNEVHMYCLTPVMTEVPEGDWFCAACDPQGTTIHLHSYFTKFEETTRHILPSNQEDYKEYIFALQQRQIPLDTWIPSFSTGNAITTLEKDEFDSSSEDLIGCMIRLSISLDDCHTGRILNRKYNEKLDRWEHFIQFKSGAEGRNQTYTIWLCLAEHACLILSTVRWARHGEFPWWPALECYQSAIEVILRRYNQSENTTTTSSSSTTARIYKNHNQRKNSTTGTTSSISYLWYYFFGDDSYSYLPREDSRYILPFYVKSRDSRIYAGKRQNVAYALACAEREEQLCARRLYNTIATTNSNSTGNTDSGDLSLTTAGKQALLVDGFYTSALKTTTDFPTEYQLICNKLQQQEEEVSPHTNIFSWEDAMMATTTKKKEERGRVTKTEENIVANVLKPKERLWELFYKQNQTMLQYEYCQQIHSSTATVDSNSNTGSNTTSGATTVEVVSNNRNSDAINTTSSTAATDVIDITTDTTATTSTILTSAATTTTDTATTPPTPIAVVPAFPSEQPLLCLDRAYIAAECGVAMSSSTNPSSVLFLHTKDNHTNTSTTTTSSNSTTTTNKRKRTDNNINHNHSNNNSNKNQNIADAESLPDSEQLAPSVKIQSYSVCNLLYSHYYQQWEQQQEKRKQQIQREKEEKEVKKAQRKARSAEHSLNPWIADGEDFTRKSTRFSSSVSSSGRTVGMYWEDASSDNDLLCDSSENNYNNACSNSNNSNSMNVTTTTSNNNSTSNSKKRSARQNQRKIQEELEYREFLENSALQPRLLSDTDRLEWLNTIVIYIPTLEKGRVIDSKDGWVYIQMQKGLINARAYQLEVVEYDSVGYKEFLEEENRVLSNNNNNTTTSTTTTNSNSNNDTFNTSVQPNNTTTSTTTTTPTTPIDTTTTNYEWFEDSDLLYETAGGGITNDVEYDQFLLKQFGVFTTPTTTNTTLQQQQYNDDTSSFEHYPATNNNTEKERILEEDIVSNLNHNLETSNTTTTTINTTDSSTTSSNNKNNNLQKGLQAIKEQLLKPSRTKLIDIVTVSEEDKQRKFLLLAKKREQVQKLLQSNHNNNSSSISNTTSNSTTSTNTSAMNKSIPMKKSIYRINEDIGDNTNNNDSNNSNNITHINNILSSTKKSEHNTICRDDDLPIPTATVARRVSKTALSLPIPSFLRGGGRNWRQQPQQHKNIATTNTTTSTTTTTLHSNEYKVDAFGRTIPTDNRAGILGMGSKREYSPRPDQRGDFTHISTTTSNSTTTTTNNSTNNSSQLNSNNTLNSSEQQQSLSPLPVVPVPAEVVGTGIAAAAVRDPRIRARLEKQQQQSLGTSRTTDYFAHRNDSSAVRTMRANIELLQSNILNNNTQQQEHEDDGLEQKGKIVEEESLLVKKKRRVTFQTNYTTSTTATTTTADNNVLSDVIIDADLLDITDSSQLGYFSPLHESDIEDGSDSDESESANCREEGSDSDESERANNGIIRFRLRAIDEVEDLHQPHPPLPLPPVAAATTAATSVVATPVTATVVEAAAVARSSSATAAVSTVPVVGNSSNTVSHDPATTAAVHANMERKTRFHTTTPTTITTAAPHSSNSKIKILSLKKNSKKVVKELEEGEELEEGDELEVELEDAVVEVTAGEVEVGTAKYMNIQNTTTSSKNSTGHSSTTTSTVKNNNEKEYKETRTILQTIGQTIQCNLPSDHSFYHHNNNSSNSNTSSSNEDIYASKSSRKNPNTFHANLSLSDTGAAVMNSLSPPPPLFLPAPSKSSTTIPTITTTEHHVILHTKPPSSSTNTSSNTSHSHSRVRSHIVIDRSYPQFNHTHNAAEAIAHMTAVMPVSMRNLTELLASSEVFPPIGYCIDQLAPTPGGYATTTTTVAASTTMNVNSHTLPLERVDSSDWHQQQQQSVTVRRTRFSHPEYANTNPINAENISLFPQHTAVDTRNYTGDFILPPDHPLNQHPPHEHWDMPSDHPLIQHELPIPHYQLPPDHPLDQYQPPPDHPLDQYQLPSDHPLDHYQLPSEHHEQWDRPSDNPLYLQQGGYIQTQTRWEQPTTRVDNRMDARMDNNRMDHRVDGRMDNRVDNRMDGRIDNRMDGRMDDHMSYPWRIPPLDDSTQQQQLQQNYSNRYWQSPHNQ